MYPLIMSDENGYVYVFQTLKEESVSFISSNEDAVTYVDDIFNDDFDALLQRVAPQFDISKDLNWEQLSELAKAESERYLARIYREKKYNRELFVDREQISAALDMFYASPATFFPILGEAGQGKTNQLCFWTERLNEENQCVLIFSSTDFASVTLDEPIIEVRNDAVMYIYYLSVRTHTLDYTLLDENIAEKIVGRMFDQIRRHSLVGWMVTSGRRNMPFLQYVMRKQLTFQSAYVNNIIEYQGFWDDSIVPLDAAEGKWSRQTMCRLLPMLMYNNSEKNEQDDLTSKFRALYPAVTEAYTTGDSMSYFVLERIMVIMGVADWQNVKPVVDAVFGNCRESEWFDYTQMSVLYSLYQISVYGPLNRELIDMYAREAEDWTQRTRGLFRARNSHKANTLGLYKRNVMNWYAVVYCTHSGDGMPLEGDERCVSLIGNVFSTAKNYFADEVDGFIKRDIVGLTFPGISKYREQILSFNPSGESLSDLFTHKFGNFLMWSLLHEPSVEKFAITAMSSAYDSKDCFEWFDKVIRILVKDMFNAKI